MYLSHIPKAPHNFSVSSLIEGGHWALWVSVDAEGFNMGLQSHLLIFVLVGIIVIMHGHYTDCLEDHGTL